MKSIGLISDTHGILPDQFSSFFENCDEIWHAGDIGDYKVITQLKNIKPLKAVYGNIDGGNTRLEFKNYLFFEIEKVKVLIIHIGGYPGKYDKYAYSLIQQYKPNLFISGHSHILKVINDTKNNLLHINPGAAGRNGFQIKRTMVRFKIEESRIFDLEIFEL